MELKKIKLYVTEKKTSEGRAFNTYHTFSKNDRRIQVKFRKSVTNIPTKTCYITVNPDKANINTAGEFAVMWVEEIVSVEDLATAQAERNRKKFDEIF